MMNRLKSDARDLSDTPTESNTAQTQKSPTMNLGAKAISDKQHNFFLETNRNQFLTKNSIKNNFTLKTQLAEYIGEWSLNIKDLAFRARRNDVVICFLLNDSSVTLVDHIISCSTTMQLFKGEQSPFKLLDFNVKNENADTSTETTLVNATSTPLCVSIFPKVFQLTRLKSSAFFKKEAFDCLENIKTLFDEISGCPQKRNILLSKNLSLLLKIYIQLALKKVVNEHDFFERLQLVLSKSFTKITYSESPDALLHYQRRELFKKHLMISNSKMATLDEFQKYLFQEMFVKDTVYGIWIECNQGILMMMVCVGRDKFVPLQGIDLLSKRSATDTTNKLIFFINMAIIKLFQR